jgi:predicted RNA-binding Zn-ribbon protein involved in translation (DUF1610 family)
VPGLRLGDGTVRDATWVVGGVGSAMAEYAWVNTELICPECGEILTDVVWFAWGGLLSQNFHSGPVYSIGDRLLWFADAKGVVHADVRLPFAPGVNVGDPRITNVDVYETNGVPSKCPNCGLELAGSRVLIRDGMIRQVDAVPAGKHDENLLAVEIDPTTGEGVRTFDIFGRAGVMPWPG